MLPSLHGESGDTDRFRCLGARILGVVIQVGASQNVHSHVLYNTRLLKRKAWLDKTTWNQCTIKYMKTSVHLESGMQTKWDNKPLPDDWSQEDIQAVLKLRMFLTGLLPQFGNKLTPLARHLGFKTAASIDQVCEGRQRVGNALLKRLHDAGYPAAEIYPEHSYAQELSSGKPIRLPSLPLNDSQALELFAGGRSADYCNDPIMVLASNEDLPAGAFLVEVPDDRFSSKGIDKGALLVCDPNFKGKRGGRPVVVQTDTGADVVKRVSAGQTVLGVAILETMRAIPLT